MAKKILLYNVLSRKKELFKPIRKNWVGLYTCGPTIYNFAHIGNLRTYIFEDVLRRTLEYGGYEVRHVMNLTDVDDKIIRDALKAGKTIFEFVKPYEQAFFEDLKKLHIELAWKYPKATDHIPEMVALTKKLLTKKIAYQANESVYFAISKFEPYGRLSHLNRHTLKAGAHINTLRTDADEYQKQDIQDFVLWKGKKDNEPSWSAPFGKGRPGWHIECSAMSMKYLGNTFDIHGGGVDLIFPHHENEIAQSQGATQKPLAHFFIEGEHLLVDGQKMAKSLGNVFTLRDIESRLIYPLAFRYLALMTHYRAKINFTWASLEAAEHSLDRLYDAIRSLLSDARTDRIQEKESNIAIYRKKFEKALFDDLNTPRALAVIWELIRAYHKAPDRYNKKNILALLYDFDRVVGFGLTAITPDIVPSTILAFARDREILRKAKDWKKADKLRQKIYEAGYIVVDTTNGPQLKRR